MDLSGWFKKIKINKYIYTYILTLHKKMDASKLIQHVIDMSKTNNQRKTNLFSLCKINDYFSFFHNKKWHYVNKPAENTDMADIENRAICLTSRFGWRNQSQKAVTIHTIGLM